MMTMMKIILKVKIIRKKLFKKNNNEKQKKKKLESIWMIILNNNNYNNTITTTETLITDQTLTGEERIRILIYYIQTMKRLRCPI